MDAARDGRYLLGRIAGPWHYDDSAEARAVGIHHVRPAVWSPHGYTDETVPTAVRRAFARGGRNFQRIRDRDAEERTELLWDAGLSETAAGRVRGRRRRTRPAQARSG